MAKRSIQEINAGSMADIAFLLLIFFLMVTTMDTEKGLLRRLPPIPDENQEQEDQKVNRRNMLVVRLNDQDRLLAGGEQILVGQLKEKAKEFILNPANLDNLPEKEEIFLEGIGPYLKSRGTISLQNARGSSYTSYIEVQNELMKAYNEIRNDFSMQHYGKRFDALTQDQKDIVTTAIPMTISESEPKETGR